MTDLDGVDQLLAKHSGQLLVLGELGQNVVRDDAT
jgi:hypothetical protein